MAGDSGEQESSNARHGKCNFEWAPMQNTEYYTPPPPQPLKPSQEATSVFFSLSRPRLILPKRFAISKG